LASLACVVTVLTAAPVSPAAAAGSQLFVPAAHLQLSSPAAIDPEQVGPVPELASATSDTVRNPDGTYTAKIYEAPVNYKDGQGNWVPIDNTLVDAPGSTYALENAANSYTVSIPEDPSVTPVRFETGEAWITMKLVGSDDVAPAVDGNEASFEDLTPTADEVSYLATDGGVKGDHHSG
jgi:hypothetical protein